MRLEKVARYEVFPKGWGRETWIVNGERYCGKVMEFTRGLSCSMHFHVEKQETFYVVAGQFTISLIDTDTAQAYEIVLGVAESLTIPPHTPHRITGMLEHNRLIEISTHHEECDSFRIGAGASQLSNL